MGTKTTRRGFLGAILAAAAAPAIVKAGVLMPVRKIIVPEPVAIWKPKPYIADTEVRAPHHSLRIGDVITIAGIAGASGALQQFKVTATTHSVFTLGAC